MSMFRIRVATKAWGFRQEPMFWAIAFACVVPCVLMAVSPNALHFLNCDTAQLIAASAALLEGRVPYIGIVDTNPPLIVYLHAPITAVARVLHVHPLFAFMVAASLLGTVTTALVAFTLSRVAKRSTRATLTITAAVAAFVVYVWSSVPHFGQREHLFFLMYLPYLFLRMARWEGKSANIGLSIALGVVAGVGACIKPHFLAIAIAPEVVWFLRTRRRRPLFAPEALSAVLVTVMYAAHFALLPGAARRELFEFVLPLMRHGWSSYYTPFHVILFDHCGSITAAIVAAVAAFTFGKNSELQALTAPTAAFTGVAIGSFLVQHRGWSYQFVPVEGGIVLLGAIAVHGLIQAQKAATSLAWHAKALPALALVTFSLLMLQDKRTILRERPQVPLEQAILAYTQPSDAVLVLHAAVPPTYPALAVVERPLASRYLFAFPVRLIARARTSKDAEVQAFADRAERQYLTATLEDLGRYKPALILISRSVCEECPGKMEFQEFFTGWPPFLDALRTHYVEIEEIDGFKAYRRRESVQQLTGRSLAAAPVP
jgi:hypothetical protein